MRGRRNQRKHWQLALLLALSGAGWVALTAPLEAVVKPEAKDAAPQPASQPPDPFGVPDLGEQKPRYAKGQLIVKYKDSVTECVHCLLKAKNAFKFATTDASDSLDQLHAKYQVKAAKAVFRAEAEEARLPGRRQADLKKHHSDKVEATKRKFPQRTRRAPPGATVPDLSHIYLLEVPEDTSIEAAVAEFSQDPHVAYAELNYLADVQLVPNDPYYHSCNSWGQGCPPTGYDDLWGLKKIQAEQAWDLSKGGGIIVGVVDTGLDDTHPDIAANAWANSGEIPNNGVDDDANGFIDDVRGWDFANNDNDPKDDNGHGTHVSGTIAAVGNNNLGIIGVAPQTKILPVKGLSDDGGGTSDLLAAAIRYAVDNGAEVLNNSWGCRGGCPSNPLVEEWFI